MSLSEGRQEERKANRLIKEKSPYLLQHAYNPVEWFPWGEEAFKKAKAEDKPVFLSIGYSTCHWCHVMERESFEDAEVAELLNRNYVCIKVDREERPDIDSIYMSVCQALTGGGGWPTTLFLTAEAKPFYVGTYFPKNDRYGLPGLMTVLTQISSLWEKNRTELLASSDRIVKAIEREERGSARSGHKELAAKAYEALKLSFDNVYGGFGSAPKFPSPHNLIFLLRYWFAYRENAALSMVEKTLDAMYRGGIFDHIGFGFSRYSTDSKWLVPHFEKMLYDNAMLAIAYLEGYKATRKETYAGVARRIFTYLLRDMKSPEGAFYSAEDADSEGEEGKFYLWTLDEVRLILGEKGGERFARLFDISEKGNFEGASIPNRINIKIPPADEGFVERCRQQLFEHRKKREHPFKDDKILTSWNCLAAAALATGGRVLDESEYTMHAEKTVDFILRRLVREDGRLLAAYRDGVSPVPAFAEDYAYLVWALIELYESTYKPEYLKMALKFNDSMLEHFWDAKEGGLFLYGDDSERLIARPKEIYDGAVPSANSVAALNFLRLSHLTGRSELGTLAQNQFNFFNATVTPYPQAYTFFLTAMIYYEAKPQEVIITGEFDRAGTQEMIRILHHNRNPLISSIVYTDKQKDLKSVIPYIENYQTIDGNPTAYICRDYACQPPITDLEEFEKSFTLDSGEMQ